MQEAQKTLRRCSEILLLERGTGLIEKLLLCLSDFVLNAIDALTTRLKFAQTLFDIPVQIFFSLLRIGEIVAKLTDAPCIAANARLIAAAPDLYAACRANVRDLRNVIASLDSDDSQYEALLAIVRDTEAALAKAGAK